MLCCWLLAWPATTRASGLGVGVCAPEVPFSGAVERHQLAKAVAQHLARGLGRPVEGFAYINPRDLRRDVRAGRLHFAIVGTLFAATVPGDQILAQARLSPRGGTSWSVLVPAGTSLAALKGSRLQVPRMGPGTLTFVQDGVLRGSVDVEAHFKVQGSPDLLSARMAVRLGRADAVVAPIALGRRAAGDELVPAVEGFRVPPPAFVVVDRRMTPQMVTMARQALLSYNASIANVRGWDVANAAMYREVANLAGRTEFKMVFAPAPRVPLMLNLWLRMDSFLPTMPALDEPLWVP